MRKKGKRFADKKTSRKVIEANRKRIQKNANKLDNDTNYKNRKKGGFFSTLVIIICLIVIAYSSYKIIYWAIENRKNNSILNTITTETITTHEEVLINDLPIEKTNYDFTKLLEKNEKTIGWIYVPNTNINYPVVQGNDNDFYLNHSFDNSPNGAGWIFADHTCDISSSQNIIIYGHNRKDRSMFGSLKNVLEDEWRNNTLNSYITFANTKETSIYKIFSAFVCNEKDIDSYLQTNFSTNEELQSYIEKMKKSSSCQFDTKTEETEQIITLYTCYGMDNQRLLVFAAKVL